MGCSRCTDRLSIMQTSGDPRHVISSAMGRLKSGHGSTYVLLGEGGIGKTHLLSEIIDKARSAGWQCLHATAHEYDRDIAYATLRNLVGALDGGAFSQELRTVTTDLQNALDAVVMSEPDSVGQALQQSPLVLSTRLLRSMAIATPVVVIIDDAHLADEDSLVAITLAARHLAGHRLMLLVASRTRPWRQGEGLVATLGHLVSEQDGTVLELHPVTGNALEELVISVLAAKPEKRLSEYLAEQTRGNALLVRETLNALQDAGAIRIEQGTAYLVDDSPPVFSRRDALLHKVFSGNRADREIARLVAVFGRVDLDYLRLLAELARRPLDEVHTAFDALISGGTLVATGSGWFEFSHPLIGELLYDEVGPAERRSIHASIAAYLAQPNCGLRMSALEQARHLTEGSARGDRAAIAVALRAADQALRTSPLTAARWYGRALDLLPETDESRPETLSRQAVAFWKGSRPNLAIEAGKKALEIMEPGRSHDRTVATIVNCHNAMGDLQDAADLLIEEMEQVLDPAPYMAQRAAMVGRLGDTGQARTLAEQAWSKVRYSTPADQVITYTYLGQIEVSIGTFERVQKAVDQLEKLGMNELELPIGARMSAFESAAHCAALAGDTLRATQLLKFSAEAATLAGFRDIGGQAGLAQAQVEFTSGRWNAAAESIARESVQLEFSGLKSNLERLRNIEVQIMAGRGDFRRATEQLSMSEPPVSRRVDSAIWRATSAAVDVAMTKVETAIPVLEELRVESERMQWNEVATIAYSALIAARLAQENFSEAQQLAEAFRKRARQSGAPRDIVASKIAYALAFGKIESATEVLIMARDQSMGYVVADAQHALGSLGQAPTENLSAAWAAFKAMDATLWVKRVEATARAQGVLLERGVAAAVTEGSLNEVELQLVSLLGDGLSNRQIAEILSYSTKTIEAYLTRLYKKTGYNSRVELIVAHERGDLRSLKRD